MAYWKSVPTVLQDRLHQIAGVLDQARDVRHSFASLGDIGQDSRAADEIKLARHRYGNDSIAMRIHRMIELWGVLAAEMMGGLAALCRQGEVVYSPLPLARSAFEHSNRIVWILDNRSDVTAERRFARVLLEELLSADEMCRAASHLGGKGSHAHNIAREELLSVRKQALLLDSGAKVVDSLSKWEIGGERLSSPTDAAAHFGERWGESRVSQGVYDALSGYSHPTLLGMDFYDVVDGKAILSTDQETIEKFISHSLIPYYQALRHHMAYNGWRSGEFDWWEDQLKVVFPGMINDPRSTVRDD